MLPQSSGETSSYHGDQHVQRQAVTGSIKEMDFEVSSTILKLIFLLKAEVEGQRFPPFPFKLSKELLRVTWADRE